MTMSTYVIDVHVRITYVLTLYAIRHILRRDIEKCNLCTLIVDVWYKSR